MSYLWNAYKATPVNIKFPVDKIYQQGIPILFNTAILSIREDLKYRESYDIEAFAFNKVTLSAYLDSNDNMYIWKDIEISPSITDTDIAFVNLPFFNHKLFKIEQGNIPYNLYIGFIRESIKFNNSQYDFLYVCNNNITIAISINTKADTMVDLPYFESYQYFTTTTTNSLVPEMKYVNNDSDFFKGSVVCNTYSYVAREDAGSLFSIVSYTTVVSDNIDRMPLEKSDTILLNLKDSLSSDLIYINADKKNFYSHEIFYDYIITDRTIFSLIDFSKAVAIDNNTGELKINAFCGTYTESIPMLPVENYHKDYNVASGYILEPHNFVGFWLKIYVFNIKPVDEYVMPIYAGPSVLAIINLIEASIINIIYNLIEPSYFIIKNNVIESFEILNTSCEFERNTDILDTTKSFMMRTQEPDIFFTGEKYTTTINIGREIIERELFLYNVMPNQKLQIEQGLIFNNLPGNMSYDATTGELLIKYFNGNEQIIEGYKDDVIYRYIIRTCIANFALEVVNNV